MFWQKHLSSADCLICIAFYFLSVEVIFEEFTAFSIVIRMF